MTRLTQSASLVFMSAPNQLLRCAKSATSERRQPQQFSPSARDPTSSLLTYANPASMPTSPTHLGRCRTYLLR